METNGKVKGNAVTPRAELFCQLVAKGESYASAYKIAYRRPKLLPKDAGDRGWLVAQNERVQDRIAELRTKAVYKTVLSINEQLRMTAEIAQKPSATDANKIRALAHYASISGDLAPTEVELSTKDGKPIPIAVSGSVDVVHMSVRQRAAALREAKKRREEENAKPL